jgi:hypothetical protein
METIFDSWEHIAVTENFIKQLHRDLLKYSEKDEWYRGAFKTTSNSVSALDENGNQIGIVFETATAFDTPRLMEELIAWIYRERELQETQPLFI